MDEGDSGVQTKSDMELTYKWMQNVIESIVIFYVREYKVSAFDQNDTI